MAFWGIEIKPGKPFTLSPDITCGRLRISQATLGFGSSNKNSSLQCNVGKKTPVLLCSLLPDKAESIHLDLEFEEAEEVTFSVIGPRSVHLTGYFLGNTRRALPGDDESESFGEDLGDADTEISDDVSDEDEYGGSFIADSEPIVKATYSSSEEEDKEQTSKKKDGARKSSRRRLKKKYELSESEEDDDATFSQNTAHDPILEQIVESDQDDKKPISSLRGSVETNDEHLKRKLDDVAGEATDGCQSEDRKVKKKKRKTTEKTETPSDVEKPSEADSLMETGGTKTNCSRRTISGGLVIEELELGEQDAKVASSGKKVTIHYTGRLKEGGQVFDSTVGKNALKFRLGKGLALDGLDQGIDGMRVGGKRRLLIPPALGFGSDGTERVPPNSWLIMDVELLRVRS